MSARRLAVLTTILVLSSPAFGQMPDAAIGPPPSGPPVPVLAGDPAVPPGQPVVPPGPVGPPLVAPPSGPFGSGFSQAPAPLPLPPLADWVVDPARGWFVGVEADIVQPSAHFSGQDGRTNFDWTLAPRLELGYRFQGAGALFVSYRFLQSEVALDPFYQGGPPFDLRIQEQWLDLAYRTRPLEIGPDLFLQLEGGMRTAYLHGDASFNAPAVSASSGGSFWGIGPEAGLRLTWALGDSGFAFFGNTSVGVLFGQTWDYNNTTVMDPFNGPTTTSTSSNRDQHVVDWRGEVGVSWALPQRPWFRFDFGVRAEVFGWDHDTYSDVGPFLRCFVAF